MPHTLALLACGMLSEWRATLLVRETACLSAEDRRAVDEELCAESATLEGVGDRGLVAAARKIAYRLDPASVVARNRKAESERNVTCRPAPDTTAYLSGLLPVAQAVACYAALTRAADSAHAAGDERSRGQVMADTFVERVTGQASAPDVPVEVQLLITDATMFDGDAEPADMAGYGPVPAQWARAFVADTDGQAWIRRVFADSHTGEVTGLDAQRRRFGKHLRDLITIRDRTCRTPWCDAPIRHADHVFAHQAGGETTPTNGQGLCEACNHAKQAPNWRARPSPRPGSRHTVVLTTPTGHSYHSTAPPPPGHRANRLATSRLELYFTDLILTA